MRGLPNYVLFTYGVYFMNIIQNISRQIAKPLGFLARQFKMGFANFWNIESSS